MKKGVTFSELRNNAKKYFDAVERGSTIEVYRNGKPVAILSPYDQKDSSYWNQIQPRKIKGAIPSKLIINERKKGR